MSKLQECKAMQDVIDPGAYPDSDIFSSLIESLPLHVYAKDRGGRFIHANHSYCSRIGIPLEKLIGLNDFEVHPKELAEKYRSDDRRVMDIGKTESLEEKWQSNEGGCESGWVQVIKAPLRRQGGKEIIGTIGIFWDITEKKLGEIALAEERNLLRTLIDNLPDYIYVKDIESRFLVANEAVARLMGLSSPDNLLGKTDKEFYPDDQAKQFLNDEQKVLISGLPLIDKEECVTNFSGRTRWIQTTKVPLKNLKGDFAGIIGIGHDVTAQRESEIERQRLEAQLHYAHKMESIGTLTAGIAHDFNNLLSVINGYTEMMRLTTPAGDKDYENLGKVLTAGRSAAKLVGQLLAFSRMQVAKAKVILLNSEILSAQKMLKRNIGKNIKLTLDMDKQLWPVRMDPAQLEQIITNIVDNSRDAMPDGGELLFRTRNVLVDITSQHMFPALAPGEWVQLSISDTGEGISPEVKAHLFEPFFTTKPKAEGKGLGLATVFGIVKQNKGNIFVESSPGDGAEFIVFLPKSEEPIHDQAGQDSSKKNNSGSETILVVDDDLPVQNLAHTILVDHGYRVYTANNGAEAILIIEQKRGEISLILTDVIMPGMNGKMLAEEVRRRKLEMKILFMSGYTHHIISKNGILEPGVECIQKPFTTSGLVAKVRAMLDE